MGTNAEGDRVVSTHGRGIVIMERGTPALLLRLPHGEQSISLKDLLRPYEGRVVSLYIYDEELCERAYEEGYKEEQEGRIDDDDC